VGINIGVATLVRWTNSIRTDPGLILRLEIQFMPE
jgi:hypothetical protein